MADKKEDVNPAKAQKRKPYQTPTVRSYGNIQQITKATHGGSKYDSSAMNRKTGIGT
jgi:hypothetical protein